MKNKKFLSMAALFGASLYAAHAQFTPGNLVVLQDGTGSTLTSAGAPILVDQYTNLRVFLFRGRTKPK